MSDTTSTPQSPGVCPPGAGGDRVLTLDAGLHEMSSGLVIRRALPKRALRRVGAWCFLDHFGPHNFDPAARDAMHVGPHPHIGLQTVTWLADGEVLHRDSLGTVATIRPGGVNVMTAGRGISHTEETPEENGGALHGLQLWIALPADKRDIAPAFEHVASVPTWEGDGVRATVFVGEGFGVASDATVYSPLLGADITLAPGTHTLPLNPAFEHGVVVMSGALKLDAHALTVGQLGYLAPGCATVTLTCDAPTRLCLVGGEPFPDEIVLWWNFVGGSYDEIREARRAWQAGERFGEVLGFDGPRLEAPELTLSRRS